MSVGGYIYEDWLGSGAGGMGHRKFRRASGHPLSRMVDSRGAKRPHHCFESEKPDFTVPDMIVQPHTH